MATSFEVYTKIILWNTDKSVIIGIDTFGSKGLLLLIVYRMSFFKAQVQRIFKGTEVETTCIGGARKKTSQVY